MSVVLRGEGLRRVVRVGLVYGWGCDFVIGSVDRLVGSFG